jgi:hypothetical protein
MPLSFHLVHFHPSFERAKFPRADRFAKVIFDLALHTVRDGPHPKQK